MSRRQRDGLDALEDYGGAVLIILLIYLFLLA